MVMEQKTLNATPKTDTSNSIAVTIYQEAYENVKTALKWDEKNDIDFALEYYRLSLLKLNESLKRANPKCEGKLVRKMLSTKNHVMERIEYLETTQQSDYFKFASAPEEPAETEATLEIDLQFGANVYMITPSGRVSVYDTPQHVQVFEYCNPPIDGAFGFLASGDFVVPLSPSYSPVFRSSDNTYIFPDVSTAGVANHSIGLVLTSDVSKEDQRLLGVLLERMTMYKDGQAVHKDHVMDEGWTGTVVSGLRSTTNVVSKGLVFGSRAGGMLLRNGALLVSRNVTPNFQPSEIDGDVLAGAHYAKEGAKVAAKITDSAVHYVGKFAMELGKAVSPLISEQLAKETKDKVDPSTMKSVMTVAAEGLSCFGQLFYSLECAAKTLGSAISDSTVQVVTHKYGDSAGRVTADSMQALGHLGVSVYNVNHLTIKGISKQVAKSTGKAVVVDLAN